MRLLITLLFLFPASGLLSGQSWEVGASGGYGIYCKTSMSPGSPHGSAGFGSAIAFGGLLGNQMNRYVGGEARYTFRADDLQVSSGSVKPLPVRNRMPFTTTC